MLTLASYEIWDKSLKNKQLSKSWFPYLLYGDTRKLTEKQLEWKLQFIFFSSTGRTKR